MVAAAGGQRAGGEKSHGVHHSVVLCPSPEGTAPVQVPPKVQLLLSPSCPTTSLTIPCWPVQTVLHQLSSVTFLSVLGPNGTLTPASCSQGRKGGLGGC